MVSAILLIAAFLHMGALLSDIHRGIPDWHLDSARYLVQCEQYIRGDFRPIGNSPWYTGNPYANILMLRFIWQGVNVLSQWMGYDPISLHKLTISTIGRYFYLFLSLLLIPILFRFGKKVFHSPTIGLFAALFWALSPLSISLNHMIKPEIPLTFFVTLAAINAFNLSEKEHLRYYIFGGIFAGIATALKYNGAIVLGYLFLMHVYRIHKQEEKKLPSSLLQAVLSYKLLLSGIFWAISFYAFEPIFWLGFFKAIHYIRQYLHTAAYTATPPYLKAHGGIVSFLAYSLKTMPHNLWIFARSAHPLVLTLALIGVIAPNRKHRSRINRIALFPILILVILFGTKPLIGAEFLLHILPFVYLLAGIGLFVLQASLLSIFPKVLKPLTFLPLGIVIATCAYSCLYEITYFKLGNIRYHAEQWAKSNLKGQCVITGHHTIYWDKKTCEKNSPVARVIYSKSSFPPHSNDVVLKSFNCERTKPLIHLIRGYKIRIYGTPSFFDKDPTIPSLSTALFYTRKVHFTRFLNGIDLNPSYNTFLLHPQTTYSWTFISTRPHLSFSMLLINGDNLNTIRSNSLPTPATLLPYEHRQIHLALSPRFPWRSPYIYTLSIRSGRALVLRFLLKNDTSASTSRRLNRKEIIAILKEGKLERKATAQKLFRSVFHYDSRLLEPFLRLTIPSASLAKTSTPSPYFKKQHADDYCLWTQHPIFFAKGDYILEIDGDLILNNRSIITIEIAALNGPLCRKIFSLSEGGKQTFPLHPLKIPFHVSADTPAHFVATVRGHGRMILNTVSIRIPFFLTFKKQLQGKLLQDLKEDEGPLEIIETFDPDDFSWETQYKTAIWLLSHHRRDAAVKWLASTVRANPLCLKAYKQLEEIYRAQGDPMKANVIATKRKAFERFRHGPRTFETGLALQGISLPDSGSRGAKVPVQLVLSLPVYNGTQTAFLSFERKGNFFLGKDFNLLEGKRLGSLFLFSGHIPIPPTLKPGDYKVFFTFRIPETDYRYHLLRHGEKTRDKKCFIKSVRIVATNHAP